MSNALIIAVMAVGEDEGRLPSLAPDTIAGTQLTWTAITASVVVVLILLFALIIRVFCIPRWRKKRTAGVLQTVLESVVGMFDKEGHDAVGHNAKYLAPWYIGCCGLIFFGTLTELFGMRPPLTDLNVTLALGVSTFIFMIFFGIKEKKWRFFSRYSKGLFIPIISDAIVPFSMALRLFCSVFSGFVIMHLLYGVMGDWAVGVPALAAVVTTLFHAIMQTYVFMMLSYAFIGEMTE
ncbi:hypothetical protein FACS1894211_05870 [Clostridia bacterium]|nr:hypothetical protein FACS1894211_05870 [Clostridia bacterium]